MLVLHNMQGSGNCGKGRLAARRLGIPIALTDCPFGAGKTRTTEFLAKNPNADARTGEWPISAGIGGDPVLPRGRFAVIAG
jgi:hypothetical protein